MMKRRIIAVIMLLCMTISLLPTTCVKASASSALEARQVKTTDADYQALAKKIAATALKKVKEIIDTGIVTGGDLYSELKDDFYVKADKKAGLCGDVNIDFDKVLPNGTLYLPGSADTEKLYFTWNSDVYTVSQGDKVFESGKAPIAPNGESVSYTVSNGKSSVTLTVKTIKGSKDVACMFLSLNEELGTISAMNADEDHETSCYGSLDFDGENYPYMSIKGRGNSTWGLDKKPYNITFYKKGDYDKKQKTELIDGVKAKKWSLLANHLDNSLMRNKIGLDLADKLGIGLQTRYVDLWMNGEYLGNYLLTPKNDYQAPDGGYILENDNYISTDDPQFQLDGMKEVGRPALDKFGFDGYYSRMTIKDIGDDAVATGETPESIEAYVSEAWAALRNHDSEEYQKYFDMDSWAKMYLMYEVAKTYDAFSGSILMHRDGLTENDKLIAGPAWDLDTCLGRSMYKFLVGITLPTQITAEGWYIDSIGQSVGDTPVSLLQELGKHKSFLQNVSKVYNEYRWAFEEIVEDIDIQRAILKDSAEMNNDLWGTHHLGVYYMFVPAKLGTGKYQLNYKVTKDWDAYVDNMREYCEKRVMYMSDHLYAEAPVGNITAKSVGNDVELTVNLTEGNSTNKYQWQSSESGKIWDDISGATEATLVINNLEKADDMQYRCIVTNEGVNINTIHTGTVKALAQSIIGPVKLLVSDRTPSADASAVISVSNPGVNAPETTKPETGDFDTEVSMATPDIDYSESYDVLDEIAIPEKEDVWSFIGKLGEYMLKK